MKNVTFNGGVMKTDNCEHNARYVLLSDGTMLRGMTHSPNVFQGFGGIYLYVYMYIYSSFIKRYCQYSWFLTSSLFWILYVFFWVFPRRPIVVYRRFGTLYQFHLEGLDVKYEVYFILDIQPLNMELIDCSETSSNQNRSPRKYPKEYIQKILSVVSTASNDRVKGA